MERLAPPTVVNGEKGDISLLLERIDEADDGLFLSATHIEDWVGSWFTRDELPPPEADLIAAD